MAKAITHRWPTAHRCPVTLFRNDQSLGYEIHLHLDNRPGQEGKYHTLIKTALVPLLEGGNIPLEFLDIKEVPGDLEQIVRQGLADGSYLDWTKIAEWIGAVNSFANFESIPRVRPLRVVVAHAESHIYELCDLVIRQKIRIAGLSLSGSPKMLSRVKKHRIIQKTLELIRYCLDLDIPIFGNCFGLHLLGLAAYGVVPSYLHVPHGHAFHMHRPFGDLTTHFTKVVPGKRYMVFGVERIRKIVSHPVMNRVDHVPGLEVHSQKFDPNDARLSGHVIASSYRLFRDRIARGRSKKGPVSEVRQDIVEVLSAGPFAIGTQLHPEYTARFLQVLTYVPAVAKWIKSEGHDLAYLRERLRCYSDNRYYAGQRIGYNFFKRILGVRYIMDLETNELISAQEREMLLQRLVRKDPNYRG